MKNPDRAPAGRRDDTRSAPPEVVRFTVRVKPNARSETLLRAEDGPVDAVASVKAPPVDGKANAALIALVARQFGARRNNVTITGGASTRIKRIEIRGATRWPPSLRVPAIGLHGPGPGES